MNYATIPSVFCDGRIGCDGAFPLPERLVELPELQRRFGDVIRRRRLAAGLGQEKLADSASMHRTHIGLLERGKLMPSLAVVHKLAVALDVSMMTLMAEVENDEQPLVEPPPVPRGRPRKAGVANAEPTAAKKVQPKGRSAVGKPKK